VELKAMAIRKWTFDKVAEEAAKYQKREDWKANSSGSHDAAVRNKWLNETTKQMKKLKKFNKWRKSSVFAEAKKYKSKTEWQNNSGGSYNVAKKNGWITELDTHFGKYKSVSAPETEIRNFVKNLFYSAKSIRYANKNKDLPFKRLEIDVFIKELNKGIEFDGTYWHSVEGLKKSHPAWPIEVLENYENIKDNFFNSQGIEILHIKESDWRKDKNNCLNQISEFLGV
jgi:hypothetical protein